MLGCGLTSRRSPARARVSACAPPLKVRISVGLGGVVSASESRQKSDNEGDTHYKSLFSAIWSQELGTRSHACGDRTQISKCVRNVSS